MKIIGEFATRLGVPTPLFNASAALYTAAMAQGLLNRTRVGVAVLEAMANASRRGRSSRRSSAKGR